MKLVTAALTATLAALLTTGCATGGTPETGPPQRELDPAVMEARWAEYSTPDEHHELLQSLAGTWRGTATTYHEQTETSAVVLARHPVLGGRFLLEQFRGTFMGMPFEGLSLAGYDKFKEQWVTVWADNFETGIYVYTGDDGESLDRVTVQTPLEVNPVTGMEAAYKGVTTRTGTDRERFEMYEVYADGTERKVMELELRKTDE